MLNFYLPVLIAALSTTLYHVAQKSVPTNLNPILSLIVNYATALLLSFVLLLFYPKESSIASLKQLNWASYAVGLSIVGIEFSFLIAYRVGWRISIASAVSNVLTALILVAVGLVFFREHLSGRNALGLVLCLAGLLLVVQP